LGFFDKVKHFAGAHGVKASIIEIERQSPQEARFPVTDSVLKFRVGVEASGEKEVTVLSHVFSLWAERKGENDPRLIEVASDRHDDKSDIMGSRIKWPYQLKPGDTVQDGCCITGVDLGKALREMGVNDVRAALSDSNYEFYVKFTADVQGSPIDASAKQVIRVIR
jgi:hypothetical protein